MVSEGAIRELESLNEGGSPLYGRFTWPFRSRPFNYWLAAKLAGPMSLRLPSNTLYPGPDNVSLRWLWLYRGLNPHRRR